MPLVRARSLTDTASDEQPAAKKHRGESAYPWPWTESQHTPYIDKIMSSILDIRVGPGAKQFRVHKQILTEASVVFQDIFDGQFLEARDLAAKFPEDDEAAWGALVQWSYKGSLPYIITGKTNVESPAASMYITRIKLCCLAEKYCIETLHNDAIDSIANFLKQESADMPLLHWRVFSDCYIYVYSHSREKSGLRRLFSAYFSFLLACPPSVCRSTYKSQHMLSLASEIPDLMSDFFNTTQQQRDTTLEFKPWNIDPCTFHIHSPSGAGCPRAFGGQSSFKWPSMEAKIHYFLQDECSSGYVQFISEVKYCLDTTSSKVIDAVNCLIKDGANVEWKEVNESFCLVIPKWDEPTSNFEGGREEEY